MKYNNVREAMIAFVKLGYGDHFGLPIQSFVFQTDEMGAELAQEVVALIDEDHGYRGATVANAVKLIAQVWASEDQRLTFVFGRELAPFLYVRLPLEATTEGRMDETEWMVKFAETMSILREAQPADLDLADPPQIRARWAESC